MKTDKKLPFHKTTIKTLSIKTAIKAGLTRQSTTVDTCTYEDTHTH